MMLTKIAPLLLTLMFMPSFACAEGFLKIPDIAGESRSAEHENEIDITSLSYAVAATEPARIGAGRARARGQFGNIVVEKAVDASSPYLVLAAAQGKSLRDVTVTMRKDSGGARLDYLVITMKNVRIASVETEIGASAESLERVAFTPEKITIKYVEMNDDHSTGDEHEIEYDIASGA